jgi:IrrE N-terminal-like domain
MGGEERGPTRQAGMGMRAAGLFYARAIALALVEGVRPPSPEELARQCQVELREESIDGARAQFVETPNGAYVVLSSQLTNPADRNWSIAHELGHYKVRHPAQPAAELCVPRPSRLDRDSRRRHFEDEADQFAMITTMPPAIVSSLCDAMPMTLDVVNELAWRCRAPLTAAAIRITEATFRICAAVLSQHGRIRWVAPSFRFLAFSSGMPLARGEVRRGTLARQFFDTGRLRGGPALVPASAWLDGIGERAHIQEHSVVTPEPGTVLTMLWVPNEPDVPREKLLGYHAMAFARDHYMHNERELAELVATHNPEGVRWFDSWMGAPSLAAV